MLSSVDGVIQIIHLSLSQRHPKITLKEVEKLIELPECNVKEITEEVMRLSGQEAQPFRVQDIPDGQGAGNGSGTV